MDFVRVGKGRMAIQLATKVPLSDKSDCGEREDCPPGEFAKIAVTNRLGRLTRAKNFNT
jgi:hypothetical protein